MSDDLDILAEKGDRQMNNPTLMTSQTPPGAPCKISGSDSGHARSPSLAATNFTTICHFYWADVFLCLGFLVAGTGFI